MITSGQSRAGSGSSARSAASRSADRPASAIRASSAPSGQVRRGQATDEAGRPDQYEVELAQLPHAHMLSGPCRARRPGPPRDLLTLSLAAVGGTTALVSHLVKSSLRLAINTSPEPVTNIGASLAGDVSVAGVASLAVLFPVAAAIIAAILLIIGIVVAWFALSRIRRGWRAFRGWMVARAGPARR